MIFLSWCLLHLKCPPTFSTKDIVPFALKFNKARKELNSNVSVHLDLTKIRYAILKEARQIVENNEKIKFVYADINCRMKVHPVVGKECFFDSCKELREIIDSL